MTDSAADSIGRVWSAERKQYILDVLAREGKVLASELSVALNISEDSIRRDLRDLALEGLLQRVHGGALPRAPEIGGYAARQQQAPTQKAAIAEAAAQLVSDGQVILLDAGTTTLQVAQHLPPELHATVVTNSPPIAVALAEHPNVKIVVLGGRLNKYAIATTGAATHEDLRMVRADLFVLGVGGLHPAVGISTGNLEEAHLKRAMIVSAAEVVAVAQSEKLNTAAPYIVGPLSALTHPVTEADVTDEELAPYVHAGITIVRG